MPSDRFTSTENDSGWHRRATIRPLCGEPVEETAPERGEGVGRRTGAESPSPESGGGDDDQSPRCVATGDDDAFVFFPSATHLECAPLPGGRDTVDGDGRKTVPRQTTQRRSEGRWRRIRGIPFAVARARGNDECQGSARRGAWWTEGRRVAVQDCNGRVSSVGEWYVADAPPLTLDGNSTRLNSS